MTFESCVHVAQLIVLLGIGPLLHGVLDKLGARLQGRRGGSVLRHYYELGKLTRQTVAPEQGVSWVFRAAPSVAFACAVMAATFVPVVVSGALGAGVGDLIALTALLALGRMAVALAALDGGGAIGALGSGRLMTVGAFIEPAVWLALLTPIFLAGSTSLADIVATGTSRPLEVLVPSNLLALVAFSGLAIAESGRLPVDDPGDPLDLATVEPSMIRGLAGRPRALLTLAARIRFAILLTVLCTVFVPWGVAREVVWPVTALSLIAYVAKMAVALAALAVGGTVVARMRFMRVAHMLATIGVLALLALLTNVTVP